MKEIKIKINNYDYTLKITLGFWKNLSFKREDIGTILTDATRFSECIELAVFYGEKNQQGWLSIDSMRQDYNIINEIDDIDSEKEVELVYNALNEAFLAYMPSASKNDEESTEETTKKK